MTSEIVVVRGTGSIGRRHLRAFRAQPGVAAIAYPIRPERVSELQREGFQAIGRLDELKDGPTGFVVATDTARHVGDATELVEHGDVLIEKPIAPTATGLMPLAEMADRLGRRIWVAFCFRFDPSLQRFAERLPEIGTVDGVRIECQSYLPDWRPDDDHRRSYSARADEGGVLRDLSHEIDYATRLFGRPASVFAALTRTGRLEIEAEEAADLLWVVPGGPVVSLRLDYLSRISRRRMIATGAKGEIEWNALDRRITVRQAGQPDSVDHVPFERDQMFERQAAAFLAACRGQAAGPLATLEEGSFVAALSDAAHRSAKSGRAEHIHALHA